MNTAPQTMKELEERMRTPWVFMAEVKSYSAETSKQIGSWTRQMVNSGAALRFNQKWPGSKTEAEGKTIINTSALAAAAHNKTLLRFGKLDYKVSYYKPTDAKYGTLFCFHKGLPSTPPQQILDITFEKLQRRAMLLDATQHDGYQQFEYHEQYQQYLITTPLSAKATKVFDAALAALEAGPVEEHDPALVPPAGGMGIDDPAHITTDPEPQTEPPLGPPPTLPINDPVAAQNINCKDCGTAITYATAKVRAVSPHQSDFICAVCESSDSW